jgi:hypothetical protein
MSTLNPGIPEPSRQKNLLNMVNFPTRRRLPIYSVDNYGGEA